MNQFGQPIGFDVTDWEPCIAPPRAALHGRFCRVEPLGLSHAADLFAAYTVPNSGPIWTYLPYGPFADFAAYQAWLEPFCQSADPLFYAIIDLATEKAAGVASYLRIAPEIGSIEVGHINYGVALQKTAAATEVMYLMMRNAFDTLGYRRYEWKCDALNDGSRRAAQRLGFSFEGVFRQHTMYKGQNRDTAWFGITDGDWPVIKASFEAWLAPTNFDEGGGQVKSLADLREGI